LNGGETSVEDTEETKRRQSIKVHHGGEGCPKKRKSRGKRAPADKKNGK